MGPHPGSRPQRRTHPEGSTMIKLLSHLSFVAITTPDVEASVKFYEEQVGLTVVDRIGEDVYLRCWGDYYRYSVVVKPGAEPSLDTAAWRTTSPEVLDEAPISVFSVLTTNEKSHDLGVVLDGSTREGRVNHYAFWVDQREDLLQTADILMENGTPMEYGPSTTEEGVPDEIKDALLNPYAKHGQG